jgi:hypothetical protein
MVEVTKTARGFEVIRFQDIYGEDCTLQESSLADRCAIWFGAGDNRMHLDADVFADLLPHIFRMLGLVEASVAAKDAEIAALQKWHAVAAQELNTANAQIAALEARCDALAGALGEAIVWDGYDEDGVPAVWLDQADAALAQHKGEA